MVWHDRVLYGIGIGGGNHICKGDTQETNVFELKLMMLMMVMMMAMILTNSFSLTSGVLPPTSLAARSSWLDARLSPPFSPVQPWWRQRDGHVSIFAPCQLQQKRQVSVVDDYPYLPFLVLFVPSQPCKSFLMTY